MRDLITFMTYDEKRGEWEVWREALSSKDKIGFVHAFPARYFTSSAVKMWATWQITSAVIYDRDTHPHLEGQFKALDFLRTQSIREKWTEREQRVWEACGTVGLIHTVENSKDIKKCVATWAERKWSGSWGEVTTGPKHCVCPDGVWQAGCKCGAITPYKHPWERYRGNA